MGSYGISAQSHIKNCVVEAKRIRKGEVEVAEGEIEAPGLGSYCSILEFQWAWDIYGCFHCETSEVQGAVQGERYIGKLQECCV